MSHNIRVRIILTRLDPLKPRLWQIVRQDFAQQMTEYFHGRPEMGMDQGEVTVIHTSVTRSVAQVGLHAPAFALAVGNMLRQYGLPQRFHVSAAILSTPVSIPREALVVLHRSTEPAPEGEHFTWLGMAEEQVLPQVSGNA
jgi:hypothetical protein